MSIKILDSNYTPSADEIDHYTSQISVKHRRPIGNLRFGKIVTMSDSDLDG